jgi:glycosyltransferase involved in cell wall biosynthesis
MVTAIQRIVMKLDASIIIPVHNEAEIIKENTMKLAEYLSKALPSHEIIICENGSTDETVRMAKELADELHSVRFLSLPEPSLAGALKEGFRFAKSDKVVYCPMDLSVELDFVPVSVDLLDKFDVVIGSKRLYPDDDRRPFSRRVTSRAYHGMVHSFLGVHLSDTTCVKAFRRDKILGIIDRVPTTSRIFETELMAEALREGFDIVEIPVKVEENRHSRESLGSKVQGKLEDLLSLRLDLVSFYVGIPMFLLGIAVLIYLSLDKILFDSLGGFTNPYSFLLSMLLVISGFQIITFGLLTNLILQIRREISKPKGDKD